MRTVYWLILMLPIVICFSCSEDEASIPDPPGFMEVPKGFNLMEEPEDNTYSNERWELGKKLFYDPIMSVDSTISCASCHNPDLSFSDNLAFSLGVEDRIGTRNAPSLANVGYHPYFTREGGVPTLEMQIFIPIQEHNEFDFNIVLLAERLKEHPIYSEMAVDAYDREPDPFVITRSLANFERTLISGFSRYDQFVNYGIEDAMDQDEIKGMELFFSERSNCSTCHGGFNFSNYSFENNGLYENYEDPGRFRLTNDPLDMALFKVPSLRNIELTAPYMHDGSIDTIEEIIEHYNEGGREHPNKGELIKPLNLSETEKMQLAAFLRSLTDQDFISNPIFKK